MIDETTMGFREIKQAVFGPVLHDFASFSTDDWMYAFWSWEIRATILRNDNPWLLLPDLEGARNRLRVITKFASLASMDPSDAWSLVHAPIDVEGTEELLKAVHGREWAMYAPRYSKHVMVEPAIMLCDMARAVKNPKASLREYLLTPGRRWSLEDIEQYSTSLTALRWFVTRWPDRGAISPEVVAQIEARCHELIASRVDDTIASNSYGLCEECGDPCMPWFFKCESCFGSRRGWRDDDDDFDDD
jgi:hypothetical protein